MLTKSHGKIPSQNRRFIANIGELRVPLEVTTAHMIKIIENITTENSVNNYMGKDLSRPTSSGMKIGFIGQGWIGKNYADNFEQRGYEVVRYAKEAPYDVNKEAIALCDIVFIAVPTPTTTKGFDDSIVRAVVPLVGKGKIAVIKSTVLPGTTETIQKENPEIIVLHSPEFLVEATVLKDVANPSRNIIGIPIADDVYPRAAKQVMETLPRAPYEDVCSSRESELIKYGANAFLYTKVVFMNMLYDLAQKEGCSWGKVRDGIASDSRIGSSHMNPVHKTGRGAGGHCFIKDFAAFREEYERTVGDTIGSNLLRSLESKNIELLVGSQKDLNLLEETYGEIDTLKKKHAV